MEPCQVFGGNYYLQSWNSEIVILLGILFNQSVLNIVKFLFNILKIQK